jgi:hypothetical protein
MFKFKNPVQFRKFRTLKILILGFVKIAGVGKKADFKK